MEFEDMMKKRPNRKKLVLLARKRLYIAA